jgi:transposase-like zinc ribbon protein
MMPQHFLLSKAAKTLSLASVFRMSDEEAERTFKAVRWPDTAGEPVCPHCGTLDAYECRRPKGALRFRCSASCGVKACNQILLQRRVANERSNFNCLARLIRRLYQDFIVRREFFKTSGDYLIAHRISSPPSRISARVDQAGMRLVALIQK